MGRLLGIFAAMMLVAFTACDKKRDETREEKRPVPVKAAPEAKAAETWTSLFDGKTLGKWKETNFGGQGTPEVKDGQILLPAGVTLSGLTYGGDDIPKMNYEVALEMQRVDGSDFFCGLTFPVNDKHASLILGGWGGATVGISCLDGKDASSNETTSYIGFQSKRWYAIRLRVTSGKLQAWLDEKPIVDVSTVGKEIGIRQDIAESLPFGIASFQTVAAIRSIKIRKVDGK
jgi:hypothetical protein